MGSLDDERAPRQRPPEQHQQLHGSARTAASQARLILDRLGGRGGLALLLAVLLAMVACLHGRLQ